MLSYLMIKLVTFKKKQIFYIDYIVSNVNIDHILWQVNNIFI